MPSIWDGIAIAVGLIAIALTCIDHRVMWAEIQRLRELLRRWEGWGRLVCAITADAKLEIPEPPMGIDELVE